MKRKHYTLTLRQSLFQLVASSFWMGFAIWLFDAETEKISSVILAVVLAVALQYVLDPVFKWTVSKFGLLGILGVCLFSGSLVVWLALSLVPGIELEDSLDGLFIGWIYALGLTLTQWILVSHSDDVMLAEIIRKSRDAGEKDVVSTPGYLFIQLDGVPAPVVDWQLKAGNLPNINRLLRDEGYIFRSWKTQLPSTTPASQAGILLGSNENIPAFRWYEKDAGKLVVSNKVQDAELIEKRLSNGKGLLVNGGVSIGNLFSGDAPTNIMVMSKLGRDKTNTDAIKEYTGYFASPLGFMRAVILSIGEMIKEIYQARRAVARNVQPRIKRFGSYVLLRAGTNVFLRSLQTTIVIQNMMKGVNSVYVDYLDYDEIAHHAGIAQPESLSALSGLDQIVGLISKARLHAPRPYEIILLSDHGQSQGQTFRQLHNGITLEEFVSEFSGLTAVRSSTEPTEGRTSSRYLLNAGSRTVRGVRAIASKLSKKLEKQEAGEYKPQKNKKDIVVTGSGNLGNIWLNKITGRAKYEDINKLYPELIENLLKLGGIAFILVKSRNDYLCLAADGSVELNSGTVSGEDPLRTYSSSWANELLRLSTMKTAPDLAVISSYNKVTDEVHAFEELVGNHGGVGGWQTEATLIHPARLKISSKYLDEGAIRGAETLHQIFKDWMAKDR